MVCELCVVLVLVFGRGGVVCCVGVVCFCVCVCEQGGKQSINQKCFGRCLVAMVCG